MYKKFKAYIHSKIYGKCRELKNMPRKTDYVAGDIHPLSLIYPIYVENQNGLEKIINNIRYYEKLPDFILKNLNIIIVNDGSPLKIEWPEFNLNLSILNIKENIKWNSGGAKNLGVCFCQTERILISDIDHFFPEETIEFCMKTIDTENIYCFNQIEILEDGKEDHLNSPHPNIFFMTKKTYFILHGYDEDFSGYYGDDIFFRKILLDKFPDKIFIAPVDSYIQEFKDAFNLKRKLNCRLLLLRKKYNHSKDMLRFNFEFHKNYNYSELK